MKQRELHAVFGLVPAASSSGIEAVVIGFVGISLFFPLRKRVVFLPCELYAIGNA